MRDGAAMSDLGSKFDAEDVRLLVDIGFMTQSRGLIGHAARIFDGVALLRPEQESGAIGRALCDLHQGDFTSAINRLRKAPPTDSARVFLGMALARSGDRAEAARVLANVIDTAENPATTDLARGLLASLGA
jgi:hypothetical protein